MDQEQKRKGSPLVLVLIIIIIVLVAAFAVVLGSGKLGGQESEPAPETDGPTLGYEEGVTALDKDSLQSAVNEAYRQAAQEGVAMSYQNDAFSSNGTDFSCYIANPEESPVDMYIDIYADEEFQDQIYLSGLIPPGKALRELSLKRTLIKGDHLVYVVFTQVEDDHTTIRQQAIVTMDFHVE